MKHAEAMTDPAASTPHKKRKHFLGYVVFYKGKPYTDLAGTCTRNRRFLQCVALFKFAIISRPRFDNISNKAVSTIWRTQARGRGLTLRRAYA